MSGSDESTQKSGLRLWAIGEVTRDKPFGVDQIMVHPTELVTDTNGDPAGVDETFEDKVPTSSGVAKTQSIKATREMPATWFPNGHDHLVTSPMVRKGEAVKLYKYHDKPEIYWSTLFREPGIRRIERFVIGASNLSVPGQPYDLDSAYTIDFDTLTKALRIRTTISDGEQFAYFIELNPGQNRIEAADNIGNRFFIHSPDNNVQMEDASGAIIQTRDGHPYVFGPKGVEINTPATFKVTAGNTHVSAGSNLVEGATTFSDAVVFSSNVTLKAGMSQDAGSGASATFSGSISIQGGARFGGYVQFDGSYSDR